jgi:methyltransferase OMS1, mitochondrial
MGFASSSASRGLRKYAAVVAGGGVYATAVFVAYQYSKPVPGNSSCCGCGGASSHLSAITSPSRTLQFEKVATCYDDRIGWDELFMGIQVMRRFLLRHARGDVLEVGAGTARNLPYYDPRKVRRLVLTDSSPSMLQRAKDKIAAAADTTKRSATRIVACRADAHKLPLPDDAFDTVVDTFGLCSYDDPVAVLREMSRVCKKSGGKILLLEHGRSHSFQWITNHLDRNAETHAANWGCVWNRDLDDILAKSGLEVESIHTWHFGTTYYVVCRPAPPSTTSTTPSPST